MQEDSSWYKKIFLPLETVLKWHINPVLQTVLLLILLPITFILAVVLGLFKGVRLFIEDEKAERSKNKDNKEKKPSYKKENILVKINFPQFVYITGSIVVFLLLLWFYTSTWANNSYNQIWVMILSLSAFLTIINVHYLSKPKGTLFNKITRTITISGLLFTVGVFPVSMTVVGALIFGVFNNGVYSRLTEPFAIGWLFTSIIVFLFQIHKIIDFNSIKINRHYAKGDKLYDQKLYNEAIAEYEKAHQLEGEDMFYYYYAVGLAYIGLDDNKQAKQMLNKALTIIDYPECYYALADVCLNLGDYKDGLTHIDNLLSKLEKDSKKYKECEQFKTEYIAKKENFEQERKTKRAEELYHEAMNHKGFCEYGKAKKSIKQAIELVPDNENYKKLLEDVQKLYKKEKAKIDDLYNNAVSLKEENKYKQALNTIKDGISLANKQGMSVSDFETLKKEVTSIIDKLEQAEEKYNTAVKLYRAKEYSNAIFNLERAVSLAPYEVKYQNKLEEIKQEWDNKKAQAEELYFEAKSNFQTNDLNSALSNINKALELINDSRYSSLKADIEREQQKIINEQKAEELYKEAENLYNSGSNKYDRIVELLESANKKYSKTKYQDFLKKIKSERDTIQAENFYKNAKEKFANNEYESATFYITEAIKLSPSNRVYLDLKQKISWDKSKYESDQFAEKSYKAGVRSYNDGDFKNAVENLTKACKEKADNEEWKSILEKAKTGKLDILYCSKKGLLSLEFIDDNMAEQIIQARNEGNVWYGYEEFAQAFNLQPHQYSDIEAKISFPLKQGNKYGRRLDV